MNPVERGSPRIEQAGWAAIASEAGQKVSLNPSLFRQVLSSTRAHSFHLTPRW